MSTSIEWTDVTWNPVTGCTKVSPGCAHCYIERTPAFRTKGVRFERGRIPVQLHPDRLEAPLHWRQPRRVFVNSMSDLFHEDVPDWFIYAVWTAMYHSPQHVFQVLTKRPDRMAEWMAKWCDRGPSKVGPVMWREGARRDHPWASCVTEAEALSVHNAGRSQMFHAWIDSWGEPPHGGARPLYDWMEGPRWWPNVLPNVWLGVSVENQRMFDQRVPLLLDTPAAVRFLSCEPLLGPIELHADMWPACSDQPTDIHWVIVGGESGPKHRPFDPDWARSLRDECRAAGVPFFMKQLGGARPGSRLEDLPEDLRIREFPA